MRMKYTKISKNKAHRFYIEGRPFTMVPSKMRPDSFMAAEIDSRTLWESFDQTVAAFEYYNCTGETGRKAAFYVKTA